MKKIFNIMAEFDLDKKPDWLEDFRAKYDKPYKYHIVLKYATEFDDADVENIKSELLELSKKYSKMKIVFDKLLIQGSIMIMARENKELVQLQKEIVKKFSKYGKSIKEKYAEFDLDFEPHITIGRSLSDKELDLATKDLGNDFLCDALIDKISLTIIDEDFFEQWNDPNRKTLYVLLGK